MRNKLQQQRARGAGDTHHEVVWIVVRSGVADRYGVADPTPVTGSQLHKFQKHLPDVPEEGGSKNTRVAFQAC